MIDYEQWCKLKQLAQRDHLNAAQIGRALGLAPRTVLKWLAEPYRPRRRVERASVLDPFKGRVMGMLKEHPYSAVQVLGVLREEGFSGGITIVKDYIQQIRPRTREAYLTLSFAPGECAQVDWGSWQTVPVGGTRRRLSFFVMVLAYSRMLYVEFTLGQGQEHFLACHRRAFEFFGGIPAKIMCDNCKTAVLSHPPGLAPTLNARYADFAAHHGFAVKACGVRKANEKGIVENAVGTQLLNSLQGAEWSLTYWRDGNKEVDFVVRRGARIWAVEVKSGQTGKLSGMESFRRRYPEARAWVIGSGGIALEEFFARDPITFFE